MRTVTPPTSRGKNGSTGNPGRPFSPWQGACQALRAQGQYSPCPGGAAHARGNRRHPARRGQPDNRQCPGALRSRHGGVIHSGVIEGGSRQLPHSTRRRARIVPRRYRHGRTPALAARYAQWHTSRDTGGAGKRGWHVVQQYKRWRRPDHQWPGRPAPVHSTHALLPWVQKPAPDGAIGLSKLVRLPLVCLWYLCSSESDSTCPRVAVEIRRYAHTPALCPPVETLLNHAPLQFGNGDPHVLHGQGAKPGEAGRIVLGHLAHFVIVVPGNGCGYDHFHHYAVRLLRYHG